MLKNLDFDTFHYILTFFGAKSLVTLAQTCQEFSQYNHYVDRLWYELCMRRWKVKSNSLRILGVATMKDAYRILNVRNKIPRGKYTDTFNFLFGKGRNSGIRGWLLLAHTENARLQNTFYNGLPVNSLEIRICIQNIDHPLLSLSLMDKKSIKFHVIGENSDDDDLNFRIRNMKLIAKNGVPASEEKNLVSANPLDFFVISFEVLIPQHMEVQHESDFLAMVDKISLNLNVCHPTRPWEYRSRKKLDIDVIDERTIWEYYVELPSGVVLLRDRPLNSFR